MQVVAAGVILSEGKVLIAQRKAGDLAGKWEFPGGKVEPGETPEVCLVRELREEFSVETEVLGHFCTSVYGAIELRAYLTRIVSGALVLRDHSASAWVAPDEMAAYDFAPADGPIVARLQAAV